MGELKKSEAKDKPKRRGQVTYQWNTFKNPARSDDLQLFHWVKCYKDAATGDITPADQEYAFLKYNKKNKVLRYNDEEWRSLITQDPAWSREETEYLLDLVQDLDMKWLAIADRYDPPSSNTAAAPVSRTVEDLKERYYKVARELLMGREGGTVAVANNPMVKHPFNANYERERKKGLELLMHRNPELDEEEDAVLAEAAKIEAKRKAESGAGRKGVAGTGGINPVGGATAAAHAVEVSDIDAEAPTGVPPLFDGQGAPYLPSPAPVSATTETGPGDGGVAAVVPGVPVPPSRIYLRVSHTKSVVQSVYDQTEPEKNRKMLEGSMAELKLAELPRAASRSVCGAYLALLREVMEHLDLKRTLAAKSALVGAKRAKAEDVGEMVGIDGDGRAEKRQRVVKRSD